MTGFVRLHPDVLKGAILILAAITIVLGFIAGRLARRLPRWVHGVRYARMPGGHQRTTPARNPAWDDAETARHDQAWDDELRDCWGEDDNGAWCLDPECSQMTHGGTGQMAALRPLPEQSDGFPAWQPQPAVHTVNLPPWEDDEPWNPPHSVEEIVQRHMEEIAAVTITDLPAPTDEPGRMSTRDATLAGSRGGEPRRHHQWTGLLGHDPANLPVAAQPADTAPVQSPHPGLQDDDGEPDILEGRIVDGPPPSDDDSETWLRDRLAELDDWYANEYKILTDWSGSRSLEAAAA